MTRRTVTITVFFEKEELELGPFSFRNKKRVKKWLYKFSQRTNTLQKKWVVGNQENCGLSWSAKTEPEEEIRGGVALPIVTLVREIENWFLKKSLAYFVERTEPHRKNDHNAD